jgi:hypothetical protein
MRVHLPAFDHGGMDPTPARYAIRIHGHLGATVLGVLAEIEALGLDLVEIRQLTPHRKSPESGDRRSP